MPTAATSRSLIVRIDTMSRFAIEGSVTVALVRPYEESVER